MTIEVYSPKPPGLVINRFPVTDPGLCGLPESGIVLGPGGDKQPGTFVQLFIGAVCLKEERQIAVHRGVARDMTPEQIWFS